MKLNRTIQSIQKQKKEKKNQKKHCFFNFKHKKFLRQEGKTWQRKGGNWRRNWRQREKMVWERNGELVKKI